MIELFASFFKALAAGLGLAQQRDAEKNAPEMKANANAETREKIREEATKAVDGGDLEQLRKDVAEQ